MSSEASQKSDGVSDGLDPVGGGVALSVPARAREALRLRLLGKHFGEIADTLGFASPSNAYRAYQTALDWARDASSLEEIIEAEAHRLDAMTASLMSTKFMDARTVEVLTKVAERKAKLLGLDAPEKKLIKGQFDVETRITEVGTDFVADVIRELSATNRPALTAHHAKPVDSTQADRETGRVSSRATA